MSFEKIKNKLLTSQHTWLVTGCAGFIGSNLVETLLNLNQKVVGLDNFSTGYQKNLDEIKLSVTTDKMNNFSFIEGDIRDIDTCNKACIGVEYVLHQAALGSVPRSMEDPLLSNDVNINGQLNMLVAARDAKVKNFIYAASSSTYGDSPKLPKVEDVIGKPLSPYAVTKYVNELYADVFNRCYGLPTIGLRYFNVFGRRQDPKGAYAAVIPVFVSKMLHDQDITVNGDGSVSRDFCYIDNVIQANILAALSGTTACNEIYNVAVGDNNTLIDLIKLLKENLRANGIESISKTIFGKPRSGDIQHSQANIEKIQKSLGYHAEFNLPLGITESIKWYINDLIEV